MEQEMIVCAEEHHCIEGVISISCYIALCQVARVCLQSYRRSEILGIIVDRKAFTFISHLNDNSVSACHFPIFKQ